jgi:hypothetical protein
MPQNAVKGFHMKRLLLALLLILPVSAGVCAASTANSFPVPGTWYRSGGVTFGGGVYLVHITTALTAKASGGQQTTETPTVTEVNEFTTVANANDSLTMSCKAAGQTKYIENAASANSMQIFSVTPGTINGIATGTGYALAHGKAAVCIATALTTTAGVCNWMCVGP